jgi:hypothetical protein
VEYLPAEPEVDPVPVRIVTEFARSRRRSRNFRDYANPTEARQVIGLDETRREVQLRNVSSAASTIYIGDSAETANPMHGWPLAQNEIYISQTQEALYAMSSDANQYPVAVRVEYETET